MLGSKQIKNEELTELGDWVKETLGRKGHLSRDLKEAREQVLWKLGKKLSRRI